MIHYFFYCFFQLAVDLLLPYPYFYCAFFRHPFVVLCAGLFYFLSVVLHLHSVLRYHATHRQHRIHACISIEYVYYSNLIGKCVSPHLHHFDIYHVYYHSYIACVVWRPDTGQRNRDKCNYFLFWMWMCVRFTLCMASMEILNFHQII